MESGKYLVVDTQYKHEQDMISSNKKYEDEICDRIAKENTDIISAYITYEGNTKAYIDIEEDDKWVEDLEYILTSKNVEK